MSKRLIIAEKPSVGRDIANVLNCREKGEGCCIGENDIVTWAVGHLVGLCYPEEIDKKYEVWNLADLPILPEHFQLKVLESSGKQFEIVKSLMNNPEVISIVCATDAGREGELIFRYIYQMAGCSKPVERLWISSLTFRAIKEGFENLKPDSEYDNLYESARCRSEADWLIGMNGSRAFAIANDLRKLSVGRVLSPTLSILVNRELERRNFVPETYYEVVATFNGFEGRLYNEKKDSTAEWSRFSGEQKGKLDQYVNRPHSYGSVFSYEQVEEVQLSQQLFDLTSLQRDANRLYGMSSKRTLDIAQNLYEKYKAITYPRTDSRFLSSDIKSTLKKRLESLQDGDLGEYASQALLSEKDLFGRFIYNKGVSDHHAIIPTGEAKGKDSWTKQEKQIYDLISRRFIGMFFPDRKVIHQSIKIDVDGKVFISFGEKELDPGWRVVDISRKNRGQELPVLEVGSVVKVLHMRERKDETKAPAPHTEASLLAAMEHAGKIAPEDSLDDKETEFGIGTPATRAATIEKMLEKEMAVRKGRALIPTEYGIKLISILPEILQSPEMTGEWEARLSRISKGQESPDNFMADIRKLTGEVVEYAALEGDTGIKDTKSVGACPLCGNPVREYDNAYYCVNKACGFRRIYKAAKGFYPTIQSITMRELLANGFAETEKGRFSLSNDPPYIAFEYASKPVPDYKALRALISEYGLEPVDKVANGGGLWFRGEKNEELLRDFARDCKEIGCVLDFFEESKALGRKNGWCHRIAKENIGSYAEAFGIKIDPAISSETEHVHDTTGQEAVLKLIKESGFEWVDKRLNGGSLWILAGETEGRALVDECKKLGVEFAFTSKGGRASNKKPAWYSIKG